MNKLIEKKKKDQPSKIKTCGSTFKNPKNKKFDGRISYKKK